MSSFDLLPPDVTSALIYSGPGSTSYTTAASAWNAIAAELQSYALGINNVVTELSNEEWLGVSSSAMASAVGPFVQWAQNTATQAEQNATSASSAAAAYEQVFASVTPPPVIALNRAQLLKATATNIFGQNNNVISQLEQQYQGYWAKNTSALNAYQTQSTNATKQLTAATAAPQIASNSATANQTAATSTTAGTGTAQQTVAQASTAATPAAVTNAPAATTPPSSELWFLLTGQTLLPSNLAAFVNGLSPFAGFAYNTEGLPYFSVGMGNSGVQIAKSTGQLGGAVAGAAAAAPKGLSGLGGMLGGGAAAPSVAAGLGNAASIGKLAVPAAWSGALPGVVHPTSAIPVSAISAAPEAAGGPGNLLGGMPLAGMGTGGASGAGPRYGFKPTVMARPPFAG
ncbi:PPE family protein [Mycobacterium numidiamassiliense]|uniref:PPE family protein n=1 Tax=Mycobacterium numidiamassiliense TaxID=1841861 RepID=UPI00097D2585|nr:PPE family protein [Mycobacterium numidiamassiliense]